MKGKHIDTLNVYTTDNTNETLIWTKKGNQGSVWFQGKANIISLTSYQIIFEAVRGVSYEVNIQLI
jgi:hypothetical protein